VYTRLHSYLRDIGANVVAVSSADHDRLVALASHVPHLLAGALMNQAAEAAREDAVLLQLAAGGFRDMTRIAAGDPAIWPDILFENRDAVSAALVALEERLSGLRAALETHDRSSLERSLTSASLARRQLPGRALSSEDMAYLRVLIADRPGSLARVTMTASEMLVNIYDIEIAHSLEGNRGTLLLAVDALQAERFMSALRAIDFEVVREK
jgi:prephenate dehydrogenase